MFARTLQWPVIMLLLVGGTHFTIEAIQPKLQTVFTPAVVTPVLLAVGLWLGYRVAQSGGGFAQIVAAGVILGILPVVLDIVGFGMLLGRGAEFGMLSAFFGFAVVLWGTLIGGGFALTRAQSGL